MHRSLISPLSLILALSLLLAPSPAWAVTGGEIIMMVQSGVPDAVIVGQIQAGGGSLVLAPGEIQSIQAAGASPAVMQALTAALPAAAPAAAAPAAPAAPTAPTAPAPPVPTTPPASSPMPPPPAAPPIQAVDATTAPTGNVASPVEFTVGIKGGVNGGYLVPEEKFDSIVTEVNFGGDDSGGVGGHVGLYAQIRLWQAVGLELGVGWSRENLWRDEDVGVTFSHTDWSENLRVPLLLKGFVVFENVSISAGVGPEYVKMLDNGHQVEASNVVPAEVLKEFADTFTSVAEDMLFLLGQFELTIELDSISIPIALRVGKNLHQTETFEDRFSYTLGEKNGQLVRESHSVKPIYTWDFRFSTGIGVNF